MDCKLILFNIFIDDTDNMMGSTLRKFTAETNLWEEVNALEGKAGIQRISSAGEQIDDRNIKKFKEKMDPGQTTPFSSTTGDKLPRKRTAEDNLFTWTSGKNKFPTRPVKPWTGSPAGLESMPGSQCLAQYLI